MFDEPEQNLGLFKGCHYTTYVEEVKRLKRENKLMEAEELLVSLIETVENEDDAKSWPSPPWYYEQLAIVYHKQFRYQDEITILERYCNRLFNTQDKIIPFLFRIEKAKAILKKQDK